MPQVVIDTTQNGPVTLVAGVQYRVILVTNYWLIATGATTFKFNDGATALFGAVPLTANGSVERNDSAIPLTLTAGNSLTLTQTGATQLSGVLYYILGWQDGHP